MAGKGKKSYIVHPNLNLLIVTLLFLVISLAKWLASCILRIVCGWERTEHILSYAFNNEEKTILHEEKTSDILMLS